MVEQDAGLDVDARGFSCPEPVLMAKKALDSLGEGTLRVRVDTVTSRENITRMASRAGFSVQSEETAEGDFLLTITKGRNG